MDKFVPREQITSDVCETLIGVPLEYNEFLRYYVTDEGIKAGEGFTRLQKLFRETYGWDNYSFHTREDFHLVISTPYACEKIVMNLTLIV